MKTTQVKVRQLIDMTIGAPKCQPQINMEALHLVLMRIADKLDISDDLVELKSDQQQRQRGRRVGNLFNRLSAGTELPVIPEEPPAKTVPTVEDIQKMTDYLASIEEVHSLASLPTPNFISPIFSKATIRRSEASDVFIPEDPPVSTSPQGTVPSAPDLESDESIKIYATGEEKVGRKSYVTIPLDDSRVLYPEQPSSDDDRSMSLIHDIKFVTKAELKKQVTTLKSTLDTAKIRSNQETMQYQIELLTDLMHEIVPTMLQTNMDQRKRQHIENLQLKLDSVRLLHNKFKLNFHEPMVEEPMEEEYTVQPTDNSPMISEHYIEVLSDNTHSKEHCRALTDGEIAGIRSDICQLYRKLDALTKTIIDLESSTLKDRVDSFEQLIIKVQNIARNCLERTTVNAFKIRANSNLLSRNLKHLEKLEREKVNISDHEMQLADKATFQQLRRKVSHEQLDDFTYKLQKEIYETREATIAIERNIMGVIENLEKSLGISGFDRQLKEFEAHFMAKLNELRTKYQSLIDTRNKRTVVAGTRNRTSEVVKCLACDRPGYLRSETDSNLPTTPPKPTQTISPLVAFDIGGMRKTPDKVGFASQRQVRDLHSKRNTGSNLRQNDFSSAMHSRSISTLRFRELSD